jgi:hypothetical protein
VSSITGNDHQKALRFFDFGTPAVTGTTTGLEDIRKRFDAKTGGDRTYLIGDVCTLFVIFTFFLILATEASQAIRLQRHIY